MENTDNAVFNLMQNVVDRLNIIDNNVITRNQQNYEEIKSMVTAYDASVKNICKLIKGLFELEQSEREINEKLAQEVLVKLKETELTPIVNETNNEYSLIGSKSIFNLKQLVAFMILLVVLWSSIKYIPPYLNEKSEIKQKLDDYYILTNYIYLNNDNKTKDFINCTLDKTRKKDTVFMNNFHKIMKKHQIELQKRKLQEELNSLEK